jgi:hypothetical protein
MSAAFFSHLTARFCLRDILKKTLQVVAVKDLWHGNERGCEFLQVGPSRYTVQAHQIAAPLSAENFKLPAYIPYLIEFQTTFDLGFMHETIK